MNAVSHLGITIDTPHRSGFRLKGGRGAAQNDFSPFIVAAENGDFAGVVEGRVVLLVTVDMSDTQQTAALTELSLSGYVPTLSFRSLTYDITKEATEVASIVSSYY